MVIKYYSKQELALLYFPDSTPAVASAHLARWIQRSPRLLKKLKSTGYTKYTKGFSPIQISYIVCFLGEP